MIYDRLTEPNQFAVLVRARLLVVRQYVVAQYEWEKQFERRRANRLKYPNVHWI